MTKDKILKKKLPDSPGIYYFLGSRKEILYIGKATSLKNRVRSYFVLDIREKRSTFIEQMVTDAKSVECTKTDSVLEALLLEANMIRTHKPRYNTADKDDKSFNHVVITNEEFPRVLVVRAKDLLLRFQESELLYTFGPYPQGMLFREALKIIRKLFQFYDTEKPVHLIQSKVSRGIIDFNQQIGLYPNVESKKDYQRTIKHLVLFFEGKKKELVKLLEKEMMQAAKAEKFELAHSLKKKIFALTHIQDIALIRQDARGYSDEKSIRVEAYDVAHLGGSDMVGVMTVVKGGELSTDDYRKFKIKSVMGSNDTAALAELLERRLAHPEWQYPTIIVVDGSTAQKNRAEHVLRKHGVHIPVVAVVKDEFHRPKRILAPSSLKMKYETDILLANAEAHRFSIAYHKNKRRKAFLE